MITSTANQTVVSVDPAGWARFPEVARYAHVNRITVAEAIVRLTNSGLSHERRTYVPVIVADDDGALHCGCGNNPDRDGFKPCDAAGVVDHDLLEAGSPDPVHYVCGRCGAISGRIL